MVQADKNDIRGSSFSIATTALAMGLVSRPGSPVRSDRSEDNSTVSTPESMPESDRSISIDDRYHSRFYKMQHTLTVESMLSNSINSCAL